MGMPLAVDTETGLITETCKAPPLVCATFAARLGEGIASGLLRHDECHDEVAAWLADPGVVIVGANIAYDMGVFAAKFPDLLPQIWGAYADDRVEDVQLRQRLIDLAQGHYKVMRSIKGSYSLAGLVERYFDVKLDKDTWRLRYMELHDVPVAEWPEGARQYAIEDAESTLLVYEQQEACGKWLADSCRQARAGFWLHLMSCWGIAIDEDRVQRLAAATNREYAELEQYLASEGLVRQQGKRMVRDTKAAQAKMVTVATERGLPIKATPTGRTAVSKDLCRTSGDLSLEAYAELSHLKTLLSKDLPALGRPELHSRFEVLLETGRTSCGDPYNLQNPPRRGGVRECFVPRPGYVFVDADYDIIELRTFAQICLWVVGASQLADELNAGIDPHLALGAELIGLSYDDAVRRRKEPEVKDARQRAKPANFGFPGGMGAKRFMGYAKDAYGIDFTLEQAHEIRERWFTKRPEANGYFDWIKDRRKWRFDTVLGAEVTAIEQFVSGRLRGGCSYSEAANGYFQGLAADIGKAAGFSMARGCYDETAGSVLYGSRIVAFVHDEFLVEVPEELGHECAVEVGRIMREAAQPFVPDVPATCAPILCRRWSKDAEAVYKGDRLVPWDDAA